MASFLQGMSVTQAMSDKGFMLSTKRCYAGYLVSRALC